jgi:hypothetical protein
VPHISFSSLKNWEFCPYYHKLTYLDKIKLFRGNVHTSFGTAVHNSCEKLVVNESIDPEAVFSQTFKDRLNSLPEDVEKDAKLIEQMKSVGGELPKYAIAELHRKFPGFKVVSVEEEIVEPILNAPGEYDFKGYVDLIIKTPDGKYHIIDWKTCSWGWDRRRRSDRMTTYQLTFYKNFFCAKHDVEPKLVETYFGLLKRTVKNNHAEIFRVSSGQRKTNNSLKLLNQAVYNIHNKNHPKNRLKCEKCEFNKTEWCP